MSTNGTSGRMTRRNLLGLGALGLVAGCTGPGRNDTRTSPGDGTDASGAGTDGERERLRDPTRTRREIPIDTEDLPRFVDHNFVDVDRIASITKFRGFGGHDYSWGTEHGFLSHNAPETCRVMKYYVTERRGVLPWEPGELTLYAPVDGTIVNVDRWEDPDGASWHRDFKFSIRSTTYPQVYFTFFHVDPHEHVVEGYEATEGEDLGAHIGPEIAVELWDAEEHGARLVPWFELVTDEVFEEYRERGASSRDDFYISREERDATPFICADETGHGDFVGKVGMTREEFHEWTRDRRNTEFVFDPLPPHPRVTAINELMDAFDEALLAADEGALRELFTPVVYTRGINRRDPPRDGPTIGREAVVETLVGFHADGPPTIRTTQRDIGFGIHHTVMPDVSDEYYEVDFGNTRRWFTFGYEDVGGNEWVINRLGGLE